MKIAYLMKDRPDYFHRLDESAQYVIIGQEPDGSYSQQTLDEVADVDALIVSNQPVTEKLLAACPKLKIVQRTGVGYENLDLEAAARRGVPCCNLQGVNKESVAEHGMLLILALARQFVEAQELTRQGRWQEAKQLNQQSFELKGSTLGIVGLGDTGSNLARRARAFEMQIVYNDVRDIDPEIVESVGARYMEKDQLYAEADIISVNTTYNPSTDGMIGARELALMKPQARLVCCARGNIIDEQALADALNAGRLAGAGLDVFSSEPISEDNPLRNAKNVYITSHIAGVTEDAIARSFAWAHENVRNVVEKGEKPRWVVNGV
ncbi:MAG: hydroxyacid dehydrogenase [SAR324 cluster bacterium]|nr:hydroxyacid dehydrogenase [SAR324 cluster bacterium]